MRCTEKMRIMEILRLWEMGLTQREIAESVKCGKSTVGEIQHRCTEAGLNYDHATTMTNNEIRELLYPDSFGKKSSVPDPPWEGIHKVLQSRDNRKNMRYIWEQDYASSMSYSQFCRRYKDWKDEAGKNVVMSINREPGRELFVDWVGDTLDCVVDESTGELLTAHFFITTLGDSSYPFVEAFPDEKADKWIKGHVDALGWYGGVPKIIVPDNTKTAVTSARYYDPEINKAYWSFAQHYAVAVVPARIRKPRDKGSVESGVGWLEIWLLEWLRGQVFYSFRELNAAIKKRVRQLAAKPFQKRQGSRESVFLEIDKTALRPLPAQPYEFAEFIDRRVPDNYHVAWDGFYYSVPYTLYKQTVTLRISGNVIEILDENGDRVATHEHRYSGSRYVTILEHMPPNHQHQVKFNGFDGRRYSDWAQKIGENTTAVIDRLLKQQAVEEQAYRSCMGILQMSQTYGNERLEAACAMALGMHAANYTTIRNILKNGRDTGSVPSAKPTPEHENLRGNVWQ
jgi:transposase